MSSGTTASSLAIFIALALSACGGEFFALDVFDGGDGGDDAADDGSGADSSRDVARDESPSTDGGAGDALDGAEPDAAPIVVCCATDASSVPAACSAGDWGCYPDGGSVAIACTARICRSGDRCVLVDGVTFGKVKLCP